MGDEFAKFVDGVGYCSAEDARVQVAVGSGNGYLPIGQSPKAGGDGGRLCAYHAGVRHEDDVGFEQLFVFSAELFQRGRADLLLAFEEELDVAAQVAVSQGIFKALDLDEGLSLVVVRTSSAEISPLPGQFKRRCSPLFDRFCRHDVVMGIYQYGGTVGRERFGGKYYRIAVRLHYRCRVGAGCYQKLSPPFGTTEHVGAVLGLGTDRGDSD